MYVPASFRVDDSALLHDFIRHHGFATLVTAPGGVPFATHLPVLLDAARNVLRGHMARANPQWHHFDGKTESLVVFAGPHGYISPSWYEATPAVPTWNYAAIHVYGIARLLAEAETSRLLDELVRTYEMHRERPWSGELPVDYRRKMEEAIVGFELPIARIEGKFKLSQNRSEEDRLGVLRALEASSRPDDQALAELMRKMSLPGSVESE
jgi:transcriptional regulator